MANEDKVEFRLLVFYEANKVHFIMVRSGKKRSMTFQMEEGQIRESRLLETFHWNSGTILAARNSNVVHSLRC